MRVPLNAAAETSQQLDIEVSISRQQITQIDDSISRNLGLIATLEPLSEWGEETPPA
jgi:hypothetical protein